MRAVASGGMKTVCCVDVGVKVVPAASVAFGKVMV